VSGSFLTGEFGVFFLNRISVAFVNESVGAEFGMVDKVAFGDSAMGSDVVLMIRRSFDSLHSFFDLHSPARFYISQRIGRVGRL